MTYLWLGLSQSILNQLSWLTKVKSTSLLPGFETTNDGYRYTKGEGETGQSRPGWINSPAWAPLRVLKLLFWCWSEMKWPFRKDEEILSIVASFSTVSQNFKSLSNLASHKTSIKHRLPVPARNMTRRCWNHLYSRLLTPNTLNSFSKTVTVPKWLNNRDAHIHWLRYTSFKNDIIRAYGKGRSV